jgi:fructose-1,6-bisphosphatase/inositol monophosphatase family enzyme
MLNSGQMALSHVAWGNLGAFLNNTTKIWDVAAGEVLIRAIGGRVTDFKGRDINYGESTDISVLACETPELHAKLLRIIEKNYPWDV